MQTVALTRTGPVVGCTTCNRKISYVSSALQSPFQLSEWPGVSTTRVLSNLATASGSTDTGSTSAQNGRDARLFCWHSFTIIDHR
ncbi:hypothetical protein LSTR_LSTR016209 [Laodelphax striatellus]|uniref:Uncharacterized protein n=1 Tax=Laodelphax striatellus TaxID=195883 RepID=A0A482WR49_LAOST|nr:hypothetical protein LSTR_LSTR005905 [Laodelphax striatellus]RZF37390.1 hypothetical protein LSTR_LSTR016209 [Laodelphax striatellus]